MDPGRVQQPQSPGRFSLQCHAEPHGRVQQPGKKPSAWPSRERAEAEADRVQQPGLRANQQRAGTGGIHHESGGNERKGNKRKENAVEEKEPWSIDTVGHVGSFFSLLRIIS